MGDFHVLVHAVGGHGCERDKKDGDTVIGCERQGCTDCMTREYVRRLKKSGAIVHTARIDHWPNMPYDLPLPTGPVVDNLLTGIRAGSF